MTRLADLSPEIRKQIASGDARVAGVAGSSVRRTPATSKPRTAAFRCHRCGLENWAFAAAERHARATLHHGRIETIYEQKEMT